MNLGYILLNILVFLVLLAGLFWMQKRHLSFSKRVMTALVLGVVLGYALQSIYGVESEALAITIDWYNIVGNGYVKLLQMLVIPLVFISILTAFTRSKLTKNAGKITTLIIVILLVTTAVAATVGITAALGFNLQGFEIAQGEAEQQRGEEIKEQYTEIEDQTFPQKVVDFLPANPFLDFTGARPTSTIATVIFAAILGAAFLGVKRKQPEQAEMFAKGIDVLHSIIMRTVTLILRLTPYGIMAIMTKAVATTNFASVVKLGTFILASYVALIVMFLIHLLILTAFGLNPITYVKKGFSTLAFAFTSRSSAGTLPHNIETQIKRFGVPEGTASLAGSLGLSIGQNGCAGIYPAMLAVMVAPTVGINPLTPSFILTLIAIVTISSLGVAGVGGGATFASILVLSALDLPVALAGLLISVEPLIDMGRTALNVSDSMLAGVVTSRATKELDTTIYNSVETAK